jgi:hypothetical protein
MKTDDLNGPGLAQSLKQDMNISLNNFTPQDIITERDARVGPKCESMQKYLYVS